MASQINYFSTLPAELKQTVLGLVGEPDLTACICKDWNIQTKAMIRCEFHLIHPDLDSAKEIFLKIFRKCPKFQDDTVFLPQYPLISCARLQAAQEEIRRAEDKVKVMKCLPDGPVFLSNIKRSNPEVGVFEVAEKLKELILTNPWISNVTHLKLYTEDIQHFPEEIKLIRHLEAIIIQSNNEQFLPGWISSGERCEIRGNIIKYEGQTYDKAAD
ncbi:MAG: hypothetical protein KAR79_02995 [Simkaniaceae bacterium]|nr:hypothetical protein [Simkaniaceae bacterium]